MAKIKTLGEQPQIKDAFKKDILAGLSKQPKSIPSKYMYDDYGSVLFNQITQHPDYYLTRCELEILNDTIHPLTQMIGKKSFNLIELGPGEGIKTEQFIKRFLQENINFTYLPIDISRQYLRKIMERFSKYKPHLAILPLQADYFEGLKTIPFDENVSNIVLFLGSNIGNYTLAETKAFLKRLRMYLHHKDYILIGFDLRKNIEVLMRAYDDSDGLTRKFNLNLLDQINKLLSANININKFRHYPTYNAHLNAMESYLISVEEQDIVLKEMNKTIKLDAFEAIQVESSYKYSFSQIESLAAKTGFRVVKHYVDSKGYFTDSLWQPH